MVKVKEKVKAEVVFMKRYRTKTCNYCKKPGHKEAYCLEKQKDEVNQASFAKKTKDNKLSMVFFSEDEKPNDV